MLAIHSYRDIINSALLRFIDQENDLKYIDEKIYINIQNASVKKKLQFLIIDILMDQYMFNKENVLLNTCNPLDNWREPNPAEDFTDMYNHKYRIDDESVYVDLNLFNTFLDNLFKRIPKLIEAEYNHDTNDARLLVNKKRQYKTLQFDHIDMSDALCVFKNHYNDLSLTILNNTVFNYSIISDNNDVIYLHGGNINVTLLEQIRLKLIEKELL